MIGTRTRKIFREIASHKTRTILVALNIFIGVLGVVTLTSVSDVMIRTTKKDLKEDELPMVSMHLTLEDYSAIDNAQTLETFSAFPGVTIVEAWLADHLFWKLPEDENFLDGGLFAPYKPFEDVQLAPARLIEGHIPVVGQHELMVERRMAERNDLEVGDKIDILITNGYETRTDPDAPLPQETWTISGIVFNPYIGDGATTVYTTYQDKEAITGLRGFRFLNARFTDYATAEEANGDFISYVQDNTPYDSSDEELQDPANSNMLQAIEETMSALTMLAVLAMVVAGFLVFTVINTLVTQQIRQIGIMKTLGASRWDTFLIYIGIALVYGLLGVIPGVLLGIPAGYFVSKALAGEINVWIGNFSLSVVGILVGVALGLLVPLMAALLPVFLGTRITIIEAITDLGISGRYGSGPLAKIIKRLPVPTVVRQALANLSQKKGRLALTVLTLTLATGTFMGVTAVFLDLDKVLDDIFETYNFELVVFPEQPQQHEAITAQLEAMDGVDHVYPSYSWDVFIPYSDAPDSEGEWLWIIGFDTATDSIKLHLCEGTAWHDDSSRDGIVLNRPTAETLGKHVGDPITVEYRGRSIQTEVIGIDTHPEEDGYMAWQSLYDLTHSPVEEPVPDALMVRLDNRNVSSADVDKMIATMRVQLLKNGLSTGFSNQVAEEKEVATLVLAMGLIFNIASVVMAGVAAIGLLTMLSISVFERQREIGVMRSVGASSGTIVAQFLIEGLLVGTIGWLAGIPLSFGISSVFAEVIPWDAFEFVYPPAMLAVGLVGTLLLATLASLWPSLAAARKRVSDILRYQ